MQNKSDTKGAADKSDNTPTPSAIGLAALKAAAATKLAEAAPAPKTGKSDKKRTKYNILPARRNTPIKDDGTQIVAARTHVGQTVCVATCILLPDMGDITVKPGDTVETDHRNGSHLPCGTWTILDKSDNRFVVGQSVRVNYIALNSDK